jgi:hypothetical protein
MNKKIEKRRERERERERELNNAYNRNNPTNIQETDVWSVNFGQ